jgi:Tfp pilus assembly protein PilZ
MSYPDEKRKSPRIPVDFEARFTFGNQEHIAQALNLSIDGMFLKTDYMLLQNDIIEVFFKLPDIEEAFWMKARVAWGTWITGMQSPTSGMGVQFIQPLQSQREQLEQYLKQLLKN